MTTGPIQRIARERLEQRQDAELSAAWVSVEHTPPAPAGGQWLSEDDSHPGVDHSDAPVLIMFSRPAGPAYQALLAHGQAGARVYVLAPAGWEPTDSAVARCPKVLIRRLSEVPVSGVHTPSGAHLWMGADVGDSSPWRLRLVPEQASAFRQVFLRLFWHEATDEAFSGGKGLDFRAAGSRPFDVPELTRTSPVRLVEPTAKLSPVGEGGLIHLTTTSPPAGQPVCLWLPPSGDHHEALANLVRDGAQVRWRDRSLPDLVIQGSSGTALLPGSKRRLRIELTREQAADAAAVLEQPGCWSFRESIRLGDHADDGAKIWLRDAVAAEPVEAEQYIALPDVQADELRGVPEAGPSTWPQPQPLALTTRYGWTVVPPRVPEDASEEPLIGRWKKVDADWLDRLSKAREALDAADGSRGRIGRAFSRLVSAMMGFERTQSGLLTEITVLAARCPSEAGPADSPALLARLERVEEQTKKLTSDLQEAERKAREDEEREQQEEQWRRRGEEARTALPERRIQLVEAEATLPGIEEQLAALSEELKTAGKKTKRSLGARRGKLSDEKTRLGRTIQRLADEITSLEQTASEPFTFVPPTQPRMRSTGSGGRFVPSSATARPANPVPSEALPEVGVLRSQKGKRYLVIDRWEDLDLGEQAASRLKAVLVAPEDA